MILLPPRSTLFPYTTLFRSDYFMQRYHDVISSFGGKTSYDADNRPLLVMRHKRFYLQDRKSGSAGMPRPISYAASCLKTKQRGESQASAGPRGIPRSRHTSG